MTLTVIFNLYNARIEMKVLSFECSARNIHWRSPLSVQAHLKALHFIVSFFCLPEKEDADSSPRFQFPLKFSSLPNHGEPDGKTDGQNDAVSKH